MLEIPRPYHQYSQLSLGLASEHLGDQLNPKDVEIDPNADLYTFVEKAFEHAYPGQTFQGGWHIRVICMHLQALAEGRFRNLLINIPPRHMKSAITGVLFPAWLWTQHPETSLLYAAYAERLSMRDAVATRRLIQSAWYQRNFGHKFRLEKDQNTKLRYDNVEGGYRISTTVHGLATGEGGDIRVLDDPQSTDEGDYPNQLESTVSWRRTVWSSRFTDPNTSRSVVVQQRVHEADVTGDILEQMDTEPSAPNYELLVLPARYEPLPHIAKFDDRQYFRPEQKDPRGLDTDDEVRAAGFDPAEIPEEHRGEGARLWAFRFSDEQYAEMEVEQADKAAGQMQQTPAPTGGFVFKRPWYSGPPNIVPRDQSLRPAFVAKNRFDLDNTYLNNLVVARWLSYDTALEDKDTAAPTGKVVLEMLPDWRFRLRYADEAWLDFPALCDTIEVDAVAWNRDRKLRGVIIENKASGISALQTLALSTPALANLLIPFNPGQKSKEYRARQAARWCARSCILLPAPSMSHPWVHTFEERFFKFPVGKYKDVIDAFSQAVIYNEYRIAEGWQTRGGYTEPTEAA